MCTVHSLQMFPSVHQELVDLNFWGGFLLLIHKPNETAMVSAFQHTWEERSKSPVAAPALNINVPVSGKPDQQTTETYYEFLGRSDCLAFWVRDPYFRCIFVTDTANYRGTMRQCYHSPCDDVTSITDDKLTFLAKVTDSVLQTTMKLAQVNLESSSSDATQQTSQVPTSTTTRYTADQTTQRPTLPGTTASQNTPNQEAQGPTLPGTTASQNTPNQEAQGPTLPGTTASQNTPNQEAQGPTLPGTTASQNTPNQEAQGPTLPGTTASQNTPNQEAQGPTLPETTAYQNTTNQGAQGPTLPGNNCQMA
ncbi:PREDICTED: acidic proline-rich protein PRP25-like [Branchiostoma belcheri]|uniref:Acidic proline-rich protein PRP25-like n=1 Tax=Branchiostoma belcheri TaxID=7741 RepID=A0A6P4YWI8_BRABE|nr:PREDICTED: acidic proline-rich protein PRP25-like [Branchiostoma belcheri]